MKKSEWFRIFCGFVFFIVVAWSLMPPLLFNLPPFYPLQTPTKYIAGKFCEDYDRRIVYERWHQTNQFIRNQQDICVKEVDICVERETGIRVENNFCRI